MEAGTGLVSLLSTYFMVNLNNTSLYVPSISVLLRRYWYKIIKLKHSFKIYLTRDAFEIGCCEVFIVNVFVSMCTLICVFYSNIFVYFRVTKCRRRLLVFVWSHETPIKCCPFQLAGTSKHSAVQTDSRTINYIRLRIQTDRRLVFRQGDGRHYLLHHLYLRYVKTLDESNSTLTLCVKIVITVSCHSGYWVADTELQICFDKNL